MNTIKHESGDKVYWLSSEGFKKGFIKKILYEDICLLGPDGKFGKGIPRTKYYLSTDRYGIEYRGDEVDEKFVFDSFKEMIDYYSKNEPK